MKCIYKLLCPAIRYLLCNKMVALKLKNLLSLQMKEALFNISNYTKNTLMERENYEVTA